MPRPRKPTNLLLFSGAFDKNPSRAAARSNEPAQNGTPIPAPGYLSAEEADQYRRIVSLAPAGVLQAHHYIVIEMVARLHTRVINGDDHPKIVAELRGWIAQLGFTPVANSRLVADPADAHAAQPKAVNFASA
jgi:hypothetical protein